MGLQMLYCFIVKQAEGRPHSPPSLHLLRPGQMIGSIQSDISLSHTDFLSCTNHNSEVAVPRSQQPSRLILGQGVELSAFKTGVTYVVGGQLCQG